MDEQQLERGQEVWIDGRRAVLLDVNAAGAPIVRFEGERGTRVVPMRKLQAGPGESSSDAAAGAGAGA